LISPASQAIARQAAKKNSEDENKTGPTVTDTNTAAGGNSADKMNLN
jgi:hypothetical protein